jgi:hypothetical protein
MIVNLLSFALLFISFFIAFSTLTSFLFASLFFSLLKQNKESIFIFAFSSLVFYFFDNNNTDLQVAFSGISFPLLLTLFYSLLKKYFKIKSLFDIFFILSFNLLFFLFPKITFVFYFFLMDNFYV